MNKLLVLCVSCLVLGVFAADVVDVKVKALDGFGGETGEVLTRCQTKVGSAYDPVTLTRDVKALRETVEFEEISADAQRGENGIEVTFFVKRKLRYQAPMEVKGCDFYGESKIANESELKDGYLYGEGDFAAAAAKVKLMYQKKYFLDAKVTPIVTPIEGRGNNCRVCFMVDEGKRQKIRDFRFAGGNHLESSSWWNTGWWKPADGNIDEKELHDAIEDYPWWNPLGWFSDTPVTEEQLAQCSAKIEEIYRNYGYLDVKVGLPQRVACSDADGKVDFVMTIEEGSRYRIGGMSIKGLTRYPEEVVWAKSELPELGAVAGMKTLEDAAHRIKVSVGSGDSGLADTVVDVKRIPSVETNDVVDIVFQVKEGVPVVIDEIVIRGNDYTKDKVIRREIALGPGDRMLEDRAERSQKRLENLDYFSRVRYYLEASERGYDANGAEYRNLVYEVEEKNTGSFMVGVGASTIDSIYLSAEVSQSNFDLFAPGKWFRGAGQKARAYVQWGPRIQTLEASITEPHLFGRLLELTVEGYRRGRWYDQYDIYRSGGDASLSYPVKFWPTWGAFGRLGLQYRAEYIQFDDVENGYWYWDDKRVSLREEEDLYGDAMESVVRLFWGRDSRDNVRMTHKGAKSQLFADITAGGANRYWRVGFNHSQYFHVWKRFNHVFMGRIRLETIDALADEVPIYNRMFLGGPRSVRGIRYRYLSPLATRYKNGEGDVLPWGGKSLFCMNFEYTIPIVKMLRFAAFSDLGSVGADTFDLDFSNTFGWSVGCGVRLDLPMFPIRLDFAAPFVKPENAETEVFTFMVGYDF